MAELNDTPEWVGVYQLETTDPVVGGAPNESTGDGMSNIPHQHLAKRTTFLKALVEDAGLGAVIGPEVSNFNQVAKSGLYWGSNAAGAPGTDTHVLLHIQGSAADESVQVAARIPSNKLFLRRRTAGTWQAWVEIAHAGNLSDLLGGLPNNVVLKAGAQTITGVKDFTASPTVPTPTTAAQAARKGYVDNAVSSGMGGAVPSTREVATGSGLTGGGALASDITLSIDPATVAQILAGASSGLVVTPKNLSDAGAFQTVSDGTITLNLAQRRNFRVTLSSNSTLQTPSNMKSGDTGEILVEQDGSGSRTLGLSSAWTLFGGQSQANDSPGAKSLISYKAVSSSEVIASIAWETV